MNTIALAGTGRTIEPTMVPMKIARSRQDFAVIPSGTGTSRIATTTIATMHQRTRRSRRVKVSAAPCTGAAAGVGASAAIREAEAWGAGVAVIRAEYATGSELRSDQEVESAPSRPSDSRSFIPYSRDS